MNSSQASVNFGVESAHLTGCVGPRSIETNVLESASGNRDPLTPPGGFRPRRYNRYHRVDDDVPKRTSWRVGLFKRRRLEDIMAEEVDSPSSSDTNEDDEAVQHQSLWNEFALSDEEHDDPCFANICGFDENTEFINWEETTASSLESETENSSATLLSSAECEDDKESDDGDSPLYDGARLTVAESLLLTMTFAVSYNLTGEALGSLLLLLNLHCLQPNKCLTSLYKFRKYFENLKNPLKFHRFCSYCFLSVPDAKAEHCTNPLCLNDLSKQGAVSYFLEIPLLAQVQNLFSKVDFYEKVSTHRFQRRKRNAENIEDIHDGREYKKHFDNDGFLSNPNHISFVWNTDGVPVFHSSKFGIWPLYLAVNELPYCQRFTKENMILAGLWFGDLKPIMELYLQPFHQSLCTLEQDGVPCTLPDKNIIHVRGMLLAGSADLPARSLVLNMNNSNGNCGCAKCKQPGETLHVSARGHVHVYPFQTDDPCGPPRTHDETKNVHARQAADLGKPVCGIKGPSWLSYLPSYDLIKGTAIDYMHCILIGVTNMMIGFWFDPTHNNEDYYCGHLVTLIDKRLRSIHPPVNISRTPRGLKFRCHWKASELRSWLLFYSVPVMHRFLGEEYFQHYLLLVEATFLLLQDSISPEELTKSERLFQHFCLMLGRLYHPRYELINVHSLLHLPELVRDLGPLYCYSLFGFEGLNGNLLKLVHGTQQAQMQIVNSVSVMQKLPEMAYSCLKEGTEAHDLYCSLSQNSSENERSANRFFLLGSCYRIGPQWKKRLNAAQKSALERLAGDNPLFENDIDVFGRLLKGNEIFHSLEYKRTTKRNNYCVSYLQNSGKLKFGLIDFFLTLKICHCVRESCDCTQPSYAILRKLSQHDFRFASDEVTGCTVSHINVFKVPTEAKLAVVGVECLVKKCVFMSFQDFTDRVFVASFPNTLERD